MPEVRIRNKAARKEKELEFKEEKGGIYLTPTELEWIRFANSEYEKSLAFLKHKLHQYGKTLGKNIKSYYR